MHVPPCIFSILISREELGLAYGGGGGCAWMGELPPQKPMSRLEATFSISPNISSHNPFTVIRECHALKT